MWTKTERILSILLTAAALILSGSYAYRVFAGEAGGVVSASSRELEATRVKNWDALESQALRYGATEARVEIMEFGDYECPACRLFHSSLREVMTAFPHDVAFLFVHFPLDYHRFALPAARAAECSMSLGRFREMHDVLYAKQDSLGVKTWSSFASSAGLEDTVAFAACVNDQRPWRGSRRDVDWAMT